ncbi:MFS transporter [Hyphomicrobium methylovorum]|uniref:MFS transporter n=1 Tax=Hyphomicrobium methylovorum TaxID=84 RepID=UPI0015E7C29D|nr:MFS transporter [Hyphomicrobium methylovorum]MBA2127801.1 MFS transporter [Hyphomicrobium methylovorum]
MTLTDSRTTAFETPESPATAPVHSALVLFALAMGGFAIGTTEFSAMSLLPYFAADLRIDEPTAGHVISAYALGVVVGAPALALLGAKWSRRSLLIALMSMFAIANLLSAFSQSYGSMMTFRFLSGVPHGAYFGVAMLVAASVAGPDKRAQAVGWIMTGLTVSTVVGVPLATWMGQALGWRSAFAVVALLAALTALLILKFVPIDRPVPGASALRELGALKRPQVWLTLAIGAIGFGGMFAVYAYLASTLMAVTNVSPSVIPLVLVIFGLGMTVGTLITGWAADRALMPTVGALLLWSAASLALFPFAAGNVYTLSLVVFMIGCGGGLGTALQTRLMDVAEDAQTLAAALNHSAFNMANALGPWLAGLAIAAGFGWTSSGFVGVGLAAGGLMFWALSIALERQSTRSRITRR